MPDGSPLERIVVVPRNGYINRLQAWASAAILGAELDVPVQVLWEPEPVAAADAGSLFADRALRMSFLDRPDLDELLGAPHESLPRYLSTAPSGAALVLAGHDRGEQVFMAEVARRITESGGPRALVLIAGGKFHLPRTTGFGAKRQHFYAQVPWHEQIASRVEAELNGRPPYAALHVRGTDHSLEAPPARLIERALRTLRDSVAIDALFIAADTDRTRTSWGDTAARLGFTPWWSGIEAFDRSLGAAGIDAMVDWQLLGRSQALIYSAVSTFGEEAAVASGRAAASLPLQASPARQRARAARTNARSILTYPSRRWLRKGQR